MVCNFLNCKQYYYNNYTLTRRINETARMNRGTRKKKKKKPRGKNDASEREKG